MLRRATPLLVLALGAAYAGLGACSSFSGSDDATDGGAAEGAAPGDGALGDAALGDAALGDAAVADAANDGGVAVALGCSDGTREGFRDAAAFVDIAACEGAFAMPGIPTPGTRTCDGGGGNTGVSAKGAGCSALDLCSTGWHVCSNGFDFASAGGNCLDAIADPAASAQVFFASAQPSTGGSCVATAADDGGTNDVFGCGQGVGVVSGGACGPFTATLGDGCLAGVLRWQCVGGAQERLNVTKVAGPGGVLCCRD